jgi:hypothetical protein
MTPELLEIKAQQMLGEDMLEAERNMISRNHDGSYEVFGVWNIRHCNDSVVVSKRNNVVEKFSSLKSAVSWCIAEKYHQQSLAFEIRQLDNDLQRLAPTDHVYRRMLSRVKDPSQRIVVATKGQEAHIKHKIATEQMDRCIARAKYLQIRGFNDEIARTRRPAPNRTSRDGVRKPSRSAH